MASQLSISINFSGSRISQLKLLSMIGTRPIESYLVNSTAWLPVHCRIKFKISSLTIKLMAENQPANLRSLITPYVSPRLLRSSDKSFLIQPATRTSIGKRVFSVSAPYIWKSIPLPIRLSPSIVSFKRNWKTFTVFKILIYRAVTV